MEEGLAIAIMRTSAKELGLMRLACEETKSSSVENSKKYEMAFMLDLLRVSLIAKR